MAGKGRWVKGLSACRHTKHRTEHRINGNNMLPATVKDQFIDLLVETGNVSNAARRLGINRMTAYGWRNDIEYAQKWEIALDIARQGLNERVVDTARAIGRDFIKAFSFCS